MERILWLPEQGRKTVNLLEEFSKACHDLDLDPGNVRLDDSKLFEKNSSFLKDEHELVTQGAARSSSDRQKRSNHVVLLDQRLKQAGAELKLQHTLYHQLAHCAVHEMTIFLNNRPLDIVWNDAFAELVAFLGVLVNCGSNLFSRQGWDAYHAFKARGGASRALRALRLNRWRKNPAEYEHLYKDLSWLLFDVLVSVPTDSSPRSLDALLRQLILTNGRCATDWTPPETAGLAHYAATGGQKRRADDDLDSDDANAEDDDAHGRAPKRRRNTDDAAPLEEVGALVGGVMAGGWAAAMAGAALGPLGALAGGLAALHWVGRRRAARGRQ